MRLMQDMSLFYKTMKLLKIENDCLYVANAISLEYIEYNIL